MPESFVPLASLSGECRHQHHHWFEHWFHWGKEMDEINVPSSTEPVSAPVASVAEGKPIENGATTESKPSADTSIPSGTATSSAGEIHPAHKTVNALDRFMERISNDFAREGKALVDAMRAEIAKLVP
jgi:hypothetical protein